MDYIEDLEDVLGKIAKKEFLPIQPGDILNTHTDIKDLVEQFDYKPATTLEDGITRFIDW
jgi:UDP-glucuronate 4-epimerase